MDFIPRLVIYWNFKLNQDVWKLKFQTLRNEVVRDIL
jgi:hypothetical protein